MAVSFDEFEERLGEISKYQVVVILFTGIATFGTASMSQSAVFLSAVPNYRCHFGTYEYLLQNVSDISIISSLIPPGDTCHKYAYKLPDCNITRDHITCLSNTSEVGIEECDHGYVYDRSVFRSTTVTEWNLVCGKTFYDALANSLYYVGMLVGSFFVGIALDWFGRRRALLLIALIFVASGTICAFSSSYEIYIVARIVVAASAISYFIAYFTYASEIGGRKYRLHAGVLASIFTAVDHTLLPGLAYLLNDWRHLCLTLSLMPISFCMVYIFIPESPRWLLAQGREKEAKRVVKQIAQSNNVKFPEEVWNNVVKREKELRDTEKKKKAFVSDLFRTPRMRLLSIVTAFNWFTCTTVFYGLILNVGTLFGDPYINRICNGFVEIIAYLLYMFSGHFLGRKISLCLGFSIAGICCISAMLLVEFSNDVLWVLQLSRWITILGKLFVTFVFGMVFQHASDAYPTIARGTALSMGSMAGRVGSIVVPWTLELQHTYSWLTQAVFGGMSLCAAGLTLLLPETKESSMTTTLQEAEELYKREMHLANRLFFERVPRRSPQDEPRNDSRVEEEEALYQDNQTT